MWVQLDNNIFLHDLWFVLEKVVEKQQKVLQGLIFREASAVEGSAPGFEAGLFRISCVCNN